jgi:hypothetical protein
MDENDTMLYARWVTADEIETAQASKGNGLVELCLNKRIRYVLVSDHAPAPNFDDIMQGAE